MAESRSELECFVLGLVWQYGPVAAYGLRQRMLASPSRQWSGSTGAIYPALRRMERDGLVLGHEYHQGKRKRTEYAITPRGEMELRRWIGPPLGGEAVTVTFDPLRTRARFLGLLDAQGREAWLADARRVLEEVGELIEGWDRAHRGSDLYLGAVTEHARLETEARRRWLEVLGEALRR